MLGGWMGKAAYTDSHRVAHGGLGACLGHDFQYMGAVDMRLPTISYQGLRFMRSIMMRQWRR